MDARFLNEEYQEKLKKYYRACFISEVSKILIFFLVFGLLGLIPEYVAALFFLTILRKNGGGLHYNHYISCLVVSFLFLFLAIYLALYIQPPLPVLYGSTVIFGLLGYFLVPVTSKNRPGATKEQIKKSKQNTVLLITVFCSLIYILQHSTILYIGYWTIVLHIFQLIIARIRR